MTDVRRITIPWSASPDGGPLGRHVEHDERSRAFAVAPTAGPRNRVVHRRHGAILDQGRYWDRATKTWISLGSCTGNAIVGAIETDPIHRKYERWNEDKAVRVYSRATELDGFDGTYPPDDTGSSGLAVCKAAVEFGWITRYEHAFDINQALDALQLGPVITGVNWYEGFDRPGVSGLVTIAGSIRGGHEFAVREYLPDPRDPLDSLVVADNSWSYGWGIRGRFAFTVRTWGNLLEQDGDVTVPLRSA